MKVDRDLEDGLAPLRGERFDAVVDVATISYEWVQRALAEFGATAKHWTFVSSISVYADPGAEPTGIGDPVLEPRAVHGTREGMASDPNLYGAVKVAGERAVLDAAGDRAFIVRAGLITGPGDEFDRFGYWVQRLARGGRVVVPDVDHQSQFVDVRDLANWIVDAGERGTTGVYDGIGPVVPLLDLLADIAEVLGSEVEFVRVSEADLRANGVAPWMGPRSLPFWLPTGYHKMSARDAGPALAAGLTPMPLADAVAGALAHERSLDPNRVRKAGLTPDEETEILQRVG